MWGRPVVSSLPAAGQAVPLPVLALNTGRDLLSVSWPASSPAKTQVVLQGRTAGVPYAAFKVVGVQVVAWLNGAYRTDVVGLPVIGDVTSQVKFTMQTLMTSGGINLLYANQTLAFTLAELGAGPARRVIHGIRRHDPLPQHHRVSFRGFAENLFPTPATYGAFGAAFSIQLLMNQVYDSKLMGGR